MDKLTRAKKELEYERVRISKQEMQVKIMEREADIDRLRENMEIQEKRLLELEKELSETGGK